MQNLVLTNAYLFNITGAHTLGRAHRDASGFVHPWVPRKDRLDNEFYVHLKDPAKGWNQRSIQTRDRSETLWFWVREILKTC